MALDDAANIQAFLSKIAHVGKPHTSPSKAEDVIDEVAELNLNDERTSDTTHAKANSAVPSTVQSVAASKVASPESKAADPVSPEKVSDWLHENAPADHFKSKNQLVAAVQAQGSPQVSGVLAPPPTPESISNVAIGQLFMDVLDEIPQDRKLSLGDSMHAPKHNPKLRNTRSTVLNQSQNQFFSPVPQPSKPRDDQSFTRMSFKAAEAPSAPIFNVPSPGNSLLANFQLAVQGPPPAAAALKENLHPGKTNNSSSNTAAFDRSKLYTLDTPDVPPNPAAVNGSKVYVPDTPDPPPPAPRLKPALAEEFTAVKVITPDVADRPLDVSRKEPAIRTLKKEDIRESKSVRQIAIPKPVTGVKAGDLVIDTPSGPLTPGGGLLTPASMTFSAVSPESVKEAGIWTASTPGEVIGEDLEGALFFKAWPKGEERATRTAARVRKILLTGIPTGATPTLVASFVFGGPLEQIYVGNSSAFVTFLRGEDAAKYYEATGNGLLYKRDGVQHVIMTEMTKEVNPVSGVLREYIEKEFTRCVRAIGVDKDWTMMALQETAARKGRKVEKIVDGLNASKASTLE
ncbi:MAG: hypothetical protein Q9166_003432 [cf. Caloplaca sp. 2 TL-2023]